MHSWFKLLTLGTLEQIRVRLNLLYVFKCLSKYSNVEHSKILERQTNSIDESNTQPNQARDTVQISVGVFILNWLIR